MTQLLVLVLFDYFLQKRDVQFWVRELRRWQRQYVAHTSICILGLSYYTHGRIRCKVSIDTNTNELPVVFEPLLLLASKASFHYCSSPRRHKTGDLPVLHIMGLISLVTIFWSQMSFFFLLPLCLLSTF